MFKVSQALLLQMSYHTLANSPKNEEYGQKNAFLLVILYFIQSLCRLKVSTFALQFNGELYLLATDQGYLNQPDLVW